MTTVGYGDIKPISNLEISICIICMCISAANFSFILNSIGQRLSNYNKKMEVYHEKWRYVKQFLIERELDPLLYN